MNIAHSVFPIARLVRALSVQTKRVDRRLPFDQRYSDFLSLNNRDRYFAQSILSCVKPEDGWRGVPPVPSLEEAREILAWASHTPVR